MLGGQSRNMGWVERCVNGEARHVDHVADPLGHGNNSGVDPGLKNDTSVRDGEGRVLCFQCVVDLIVCSVEYGKKVVKKYVSCHALCRSFAIE